MGAPTVYGSSSPGSPGISGAIKDAVAAVAKSFAPKAITQRKAKVAQGIEQNDGSNAGSEDTRVPGNETTP